MESSIKASYLTSAKAVIVLSMGPGRSVTIFSFRLSGKYNGELAGQVYHQDGGGLAALAHGQQGQPGGLFPIRQCNTHQIGQRIHLEGHLPEHI